MEMKGVSCKAGYRYLLRDINWEVGRGEHWVVFGVNGSGKTTLLSIIAGFKHFTDGTVKVFGQEFSNDNILAIRERIGWVSSSFFDKYYSKESALNIVLSGKHGTLGLDEDITLEDAVSYTHLDVYKRQAFERAAFLQMSVNSGGYCRYKGNHYIIRHFDQIRSK